MAHKTPQPADLDNQAAKLRDLADDVETIVPRRAEAMRKVADSNGSSAASGAPDVFEALHNYQQAYLDAALEIGTILVLNRGSVSDPSAADDALSAITQLSYEFPRSAKSSTTPRTCCSKKRGLWASTRFAAGPAQKQMMAASLMRTSTAS